MKIGHVCTVALAWLASIDATMAQKHEHIRSNANDSRVPTRYGIILFPQFQALDVFGPLDVLTVLSWSQNMNLSIIAATMNPVSTYPYKKMVTNSNFSQAVVPTHTFANPPKDLEVLFVPGGIGTRAPGLDPLIQYVRDTYPSLKYLVSVCTGAGLIARAGILDGRNATTNKRAWNATTALGPKTYWVGKARWVVDGNIITSSGVAAGIDATFAYISEIFGDAKAQQVAESIEYVRITDSHEDPFAAINGVQDVPPIKPRGNGTH